MHVSLRASTTNFVLAGVATCVLFKTYQLISSAQTHSMTWGDMYQKAQSIFGKIIGYAAIGAVGGGIVHALSSKNKNPLQSLEVVIGPTAFLDKDPEEALRNRLHQLEIITPTLRINLPEVQLPPFAKDAGPFTPMYMLIKIIVFSLKAVNTMEDMKKAIPKIGIGAGVGAFIGFMKA